MRAEHGIFGGAGWRRAFVAFALIAIAVRALVPAGYMLGAAEAGRIAVVLCGGHGGALTLDLASGEWRESDEHAPSPSKQTAAEQGCVFAASVAAAPPPLVEAPAAPRLAIAPIVGPALETRPGRGLAAPPPWSTGPPRSA